MMTTTRAAGGATAYTRAGSSESRLSSATGYAAFDPRDEWYRRWDRLIGKLLDVRVLEDDWDGQGAVAPPPALVGGAINLAKHLQAAGDRPADFAIPGVNGTILFEWHDPAAYSEIEVIAPDRAVQRTVRRGAAEAEEVHLVRCW